MGSAWRCLPYVVACVVVGGTLAWSGTVVDDSVVSAVALRAKVTAASFCARRLVGASETDPVNSSVKVKVVFGATLLGDPVRCGLEIALRQLRGLHAVGLLCEGRGCAEVHVVLTSDGGGAGGRVGAPSLREAASAVAALATSLSGGRAVVHRIGSNSFEAPALHRLWVLGCESPSSLFLYFHNKGATRLPDGLEAGEADADGPGASVGGRRTVWEVSLFREVVAPWRSVARLFDAHGARMQHAGLAAANGGWQWFNFFWARGSYLAARVEPIRSLQRHYSEAWLGLDAAAPACASRRSEPGAEVPETYNAQTPRGSRVWAAKGCFNVTFQLRVFLAIT